MNGWLVFGSSHYLKHSRSVAKSCVKIDGLLASKSSLCVAHMVTVILKLICRLDSSVHDLLDPQYASVDTKMDSRIQRKLS